MLEISFISFFFIRFLEVIIFLMIFNSTLKQSSAINTIISFFISIPTTLLFIYAGTVGYIGLFITLFIFTPNKKKTDKLLALALSWLIMYLQALIYSNLYLLFLKDTTFIQNEIIFVLIYSLLLVTFTFLIFYIIRILHKNLKQAIHNYSKKNYINYFISLTIFSLFLATVYVQFNPDNTGKSMFFITSISLIFIIFIFFTTFYFFKKIKLNLQKQADKEEIERLVSYTEKLEKNQQQLRKFKHDYLNILLSLQIAIDTKNINVIQDEFAKVNHYSLHEFDQHTTNVDDLSNIHVMPIKSIFLSKILYWEKSIVNNLSFECKKTISNFYIDDIILVRILGNLMDNAYEEVISQFNNESFIQIAIIDEETNIEIIIQNSIQTQLKHFKTLSTANYTTKENHSGLGLTTVKQLVEENKNLNLFTHIDSNKNIFSITLLLEKI